MSDLNDKFKNIGDFSELELPKLEDDFLGSFASYAQLSNVVNDFKPIDIKETSGMNELIKIQIETLNKQNEMVNKQSETINKLIDVIKQQDLMIEGGNRDAKEARFFSILSNLLAIIAIVISIILN